MVRLRPEESLSSQESTAESPPPETRLAFLITTLENVPQLDQRAPRWELAGLLRCSGELRLRFWALEEKIGKAPLLLRVKANKAFRLTNKIQLWKMLPKIVLFGLQNLY